MAMKQCPVCGEKYSDTYEKCPFCEEEEALQSGGQIRRGTAGRGGRRAARSRQPNLLSPILVVLILIMAGLLVYCSSATRSRTGCSRRSKRRRWRM